MKKIIYIFLFSLITMASLSSCQKEEVKPNADLNGGGHGSDPK